MSVRGHARDIVDKRPRMLAAAFFRRRKMLTPRSQIATGGGA